MKKRISILVTCVLMMTHVFGQTFLTPKPLTSSVKLAPVSKPQNIPYITWGGDVVTFLAQQNGILKANGFPNATFFKGDDFQKQVNACIGGQTPYLRGTLGMINAAIPAFKDAGTDLVIIYKFTNSAGGDCMVVKQGKNLKNIQNIALQLYGPHMDYAAKLVNDAGRLKNVTFKWLPNLYSDGKGAQDNAVTAFQKNTSIDAAMVIIPDGAALTSGGSVGNGAEGSVKGSTILTSTKTNSEIIMDVYAVRKDYFDANRTTVFNFVRSLMLADEALRDLRKTPTVAGFKTLMKTAGDKFGLQPADAQALMGDAEFVGYNGNVSFFTGKTVDGKITTRNLSSVSTEIQSFFISLGLIKGKNTVLWANWDFAALAKGLKYANAVTNNERFDTKKVNSTIATMAEKPSWNDDGTLYEFTINFSPNQTDFPLNVYAANFEQVLKIAQASPGAIVVIEGHTDIMPILEAQKNKQSVGAIDQLRQAQKSLSVKRSEAAMLSFMAYCQGKKYLVDKSQFHNIGLGSSNPLFPIPQDESQWKQNMRVVFRVKQIEAESSVFKPIN